MSKSISECEELQIVTVTNDNTGNSLTVSYNVEMGWTCRCNGMLLKRKGSKQDMIDFALNYL